MSRKKLNDNEILEELLKDSDSVEESKSDEDEKCTEAQGRRVFKNHNCKVSREEILAVIGIIYARGILGKNQSIDHLLSRKWGSAFFRDTMPRHQFKELMRFLRFDIVTVRSERLRTDKFAYISEVWDRFIENCKAAYKPHENIIINEQLFPSKCRCPFLQYMGNKPDKFGIKFWIAADTESKYMLNAFPYLGKDEFRPANQPLSTQVVLRLMKPFTRKARNGTTDNFFTSLQLAEHLKAKDTSIVGTMNKARREIPSQMKSWKGDGQKKRPETVVYYNATKFGVDVHDQMARIYSTSCPSRRWPVHVSYNILDRASINAWILYSEVTGEKLSRHDFNLGLAEELAYSLKNLELAESAEDSDEILEEESKTPNKKRKQCQIRLCKNNKTMMSFKKCEKYVCGKCTAVTKQIVFCKLCKK
ncbi:piggyBac transposable element-derived protein 4-like [Palaemon carinicauda]|uniref:piggyBac transposable element-derived protein 4-like n=1 Tax=Palaemon carinicauda TaxID=392227 RepID=UPI0035B6582F